MKNPIESVHHFCTIQLEILKDHEYKLRKEIQNCNVQREFLTQTLSELGEWKELSDDTIERLLSTIRNGNK
jgi:FtsZ-binding cell division protein ZapB